MTGFIKHNIAPIVCGVVAALAIAVSMGSVNTARATLAEQDATIAGLENRIAVVAHNQQVGEQTTVEQTSGLSAERKAQDDEVIGKFLTDICTWDSFETYQAARERAATDYKIPADSKFFEVFMPEVKEYADADNPDAEKFNIIDGAGYNMKYKDITSYVTGIAGDTYNYFVLVTVTSADAQGVEGEGTAVLLCSVDGLGNIADVDALAISIV